MNRAQNRYKLDYASYVIVLKLENIKELSRNLSDLPESQFCVFEQAYKEGLLVNEQSLNLMEVLASLSLKLHCNTSDSGIYSDDAEPCQKPKNKCDNRSSYMVHQQPCSIDKPTSQVVNSVKTDASQNAETLIGTYMYSEGSLIKLKSVKPRSRSDQYKYCVQFLFKSTKILIVFGYYDIMFLLGWIEVQKEQNYRR